MKKRNQSSSLNGAPNPISASGGLWFAPESIAAMEAMNAAAKASAQTPSPTAEARVEPKSGAPRQPQYAWEMTLEQFQQQFFPDLCSNRRVTETEPTSQRDAA